ncbi:MAG TPA: 6-phosphogluconolactonase [Puia sp.]|jgi:6-phosphogluconolactonase|nr:6-phosphogluconolactonase [Puia sp.]
MQLHIYKDAGELSQAVAQWITDMIGETLRSRDRFTIALSGGSTPELLHRILAGAPFKEQIDWSKLHIFWGDERAVPFEDSRNNAKMAYDTLLNFVPVPASQIHVMRTDIPPEQSAAEYEKILHQYFDAVPGGGAADPGTGTIAPGGASAEPAGGLLPNSFDLVLLGMGDDGHTLSLFPGTAVVHEDKRWATAFFLKAQDMYRITLTKSIVNRAARVAFLTTGTKKAHALREVLQGDYNPDLYPSQEIKPLDGELHWFVDEAAAAQLK